jgi:two-component system NtrC family sensor kinase
MLDANAADPQQIITELQGQLDQRTVERDKYRAERDEALERETATAEVLQVINSSPGDLERVFDAMLEKAMRLCGNDNGEIFQLQDGAYRLAVSRGLEPEYLAVEAGGWRRSAAITPGSDTLVGRTAAAGRPVHILDAWEELYGAKGQGAPWQVANHAWRSAVT